MIQFLKISGVVFLLLAAGYFFMIGGFLYFVYLPIVIGLDIIFPELIASSFGLALAFLLYFGPLIFLVNKIAKQKT